jgi:hypothetical protein
MILAGMRSSLSPRSIARSPNADLNLEIATAVLAGFAPDFFDSHGHLTSTWFDRIRRVPNESPANIDNWWHASRSISPDDRPARWRH